MSSLFEQIAVARFLILVTIAYFVLYGVFRYYKIIWDTPIIHITVNLIFVKFWNIS
jgi:hypothetical protein